MAVDPKVIRDRLRTQGGPSLELLRLLDEHRVMTTDHLAQASGTPVRTVRRQLGQVHTAGLVAYTRPGREAGTSQRYWWLTRAGARLVTGTAPADGKTPSPMFVAHAAAITGTWLAIRDHAGDDVRVQRWWPDRAAWESWRGVRLTPDALLYAELGDVVVPAWIEVDLATMPQGSLREKVSSQ